jgi:hypothetical protein
MTMESWWGSRRRGELREELVNASHSVAPWLLAEMQSPRLMPLEQARGSWAQQSSD